MNKVKIEFINTCPSCDGYVALLKEIEGKYPDKMDLTVYYIGKDFEYIDKYGQIIHGTLIISETELFEDLGRKKMEKIILSALGV